MDTEQPTTATALANMVGEADLISGLSHQEVREALLIDPNISHDLKAKEETSDAPKGCCKASHQPPRAFFNCGIS